jgi:ubiquinone/menaquinone biosynthesis C-methylase UbiE
MPDYRQIYASDADRYHDLVAAEDHQRNLPRVLSSLVELRGARVIEMGMGTGRVTREMIDAGASVSGYDESPAMIAVARQRLGEREYRATVADVRSLTLPERSADIPIAAWMLGHFCEWYAESWMSEIDKVLSTMWNALDQGGTLVIIETLGTGSELPGAPNAELAAYYRHLEETWGMNHKSSSV